MIIIKYIEYQELENETVLFFDYNGEKRTYTFPDTIFEFLANNSIKGNTVIDEELFQELRCRHFSYELKKNLSGMNKETLIDNALDNNID